MILSMTGYGQATREIGEKKYRLEIKSLNGKTTDIRFKTSINLQEKELEVRKLILDKAHRGKFDVSLTLDSAFGAEEFEINEELMQFYFNSLRKFQNKNAIDSGDFIQALVKLPNVVQTVENEVSETLWAELRPMVLEALSNLEKFRLNEGISLENDILTRINNIEGLLSQVDDFESLRIENLRERIKKNLNQFMSKDNIDENRFEQEILFYLEKLDINEEKVRLAQHCVFFKEVVSMEVFEKGKKLSFIGQEIGREINTLGAKAQQPNIQQIVVKMKDELEKIKEQVLNIV